MCVVRVKLIYTVYMSGMNTDDFLNYYLGCRIENSEK